MLVFSLSALHFSINSVMNALHTSTLLLHCKQCYLREGMFTVITVHRNGYKTWMNKVGSMKKYVYGTTNVK